MERNTRQKLLVEAEMSKINSLFTAEDLYIRLKKIDSKIGIATVYRVLNKLTADKKLFVYSCNRRSVFSKTKTSHCHFTCDICKQIVHFEINKLDFLKKEISGSISRVQIDVSGICDKCKNSKI